MAESAEADFVLDASALAKLVLDEDESAAFRRWYRERIAEGARFAAPGLLGYEMAELVARNVRPAPSPQAFQALIRNLVEGVRLDPAFDAVGPYLLRTTAYDASYLATAAEAQAVLVTYDHALLRAAKAHSVPAEAP